MARPRILSGMRPTGALHLGNLMGALDNWVRLQDSHECFFAIVDWHSLTTDYADPSAIRESILEVATDWLAAGGGPVGEDQAPHMELSREIVRRFNNLYGPVFPEPQTLLTEAKRIPGTDGRKMSKSYGNAVYIKDDPETVREKIRPMVTDPARKRRHDPGTPEECPVFDLHKAFSSPESQAWAAEGCRSAGIGCLDCKGRLIEHMLVRLDTIHARRPEFAARPDTVWDILFEGSKKARAVAQAT